MIKVTEQVNHSNDNALVQPTLLQPTLYSNVPTSLGYYGVNYDGQVTYNKLIENSDKQTDKESTDDSSSVTVPYDLKLHIISMVKVIHNDLNMLKQFVDSIYNENGIQKSETLSLKEITIKISVPHKTTYIVELNSQGKITKVVDTHDLPKDTQKTTIFSGKLDVSIHNEILSDVAFTIKYIGILTNTNKLILTKFIDIECLFIDEKYRRKGIGTKLINMLKEKLNVTGIIVHSPVLKAHDFYMKNGIWLLVTNITPEIYNYIKDELSFKLVPIQDVFKGLLELESILNIQITSRLSDCLLLDNSSENIKNYFIARYVKNVDIYTGVGVWFNKTQLQSLLHTIADGRFKPKQ